MLRNFFTVALRNLVKFPVYSLINIVGLSVGITCSLLILLWVFDEYSYNRYFTKYENLYQVKMNKKYESGTITANTTPMPLKDVLLQQDSRIQRMAITIGQSALLSVGDKKLNKVGFDVSESFLDMFDFKMLAGDPKSALRDARSIILTHSTARALFGDEDAIGKTVIVKIENNEPLKVAGIIEDLPSNISFRFDFLLPFAYFEHTAPWLEHAIHNWGNNSFTIYAELQPGTNPSVINESIRDVIKQHSPEKLDAELFLHPMSHWRLYNNFENGKEAGGQIQYVRLFSGIAIFILVTACINFMNLSTARSEHRAREVGIRKSVGSSRKLLIFQFVGESLLIAGLAFLTSLVLAELALPFYNNLVDKQLTLGLYSVRFWIFGLTLIIGTGILAGSYPALYLSSFKTSSILKGKSKVSSNGTTPRSILVTTQFVFTILLFIGTAVVYKQLHHLKDREAGYDRENLMMIWSTSDIEKNFHPLKEDLLRGAAVSVCKSNSPVTRIFASSPIDAWTGMSPGQRVEVTNIATEYDYTKTMGIRMIEGRDFSEDFKSDTNAMILNKTAVQVLNLKEPIGDKIKMWDQWWHIIGVMDDVLMGSGSRNIDPLVMTMDPTWSSTITVRLPKTADLASAIQRVENSFKKFNPDYPFEYRFADAEFEMKFNAVAMIGKLTDIFAVLAIFITGMGLFGMAAFTAEQRTKEIGIRKVLGASVSGLVVLLTKDFSRLVLWAFLVSVPLAWWATANFLEQYQVRIPMPVWVFPVAGILVFLLTVAIVITQAVRAAMGNPVDSLRNE